MTVTKYLCGRVILDNMRVLVKRRLESDAQKQGKSGLGSTTIYLANKRAEKRQGTNFFVAYWRSITRKATDMESHNYRNKKIMIKKTNEGLQVKAVMSKSIEAAPAPEENRS